MDSQSQRVRIYRRYVPSKSVIPIGSIKGQIGHLLAASGIAGLIKSLLCVSQGLRPKSVNFENPNPRMRTDVSPLYVNRSNSSWLREGTKPRRAAVSSMGFGGTNFHVIIEEHKEYDKGNGAHLIVRLGGKTMKEVEDRLSSLVSTRAAPSSLNEHRLIYDLLTETEKSGTQPAGVSFLVSTAEPLSPQLAVARKALTGGSDQISGIRVWNGIAPDSPAEEKVCIMFPGQGSEFVSMGLGLIELFPESRQVMRKADRIAIRRWGFSLSEVISGNVSIGGLSGSDLLHRTEYCQPAVFTISLACHEALRSMGLKPFSAIGHSLGEYSALVAAGAIDFEEGLDAVMERGKVMARYAAPGIMAAVFAEVGKVKEILEELDGVYLANLNSERQQIISGSHEAIERARETLRERGISTGLLPVTGAFHSPLMTEAQAIFRPTLEKLHYKTLQFSVYSNVRTQTYPPDKMSSFAPMNLLDQIVAPVQFMEQVHLAHREGANLFLEVGPGMVLFKIVQSLGMKALATIPNGHDSLPALLNAIVLLNGSVCSANLMKLNQRLAAGLKCVDLSSKPKICNADGAGRGVQSGHQAFTPAGPAGNQRKLTQNYRHRVQAMPSPEQSQRFAQLLTLIQQVGDPVLLGLLNSPRFNLFVHNETNIIYDTVVKTILHTYKDYRRAQPVPPAIQEANDSSSEKPSSTGIQSPGKTPQDQEILDFEEVIASLTPSTNVGFLLKQVKSARGPLA